MARRKLPTEYTIAQAAARLPYSRMWVYKKVRSGQLRGYQLTNGEWRVPVEEFNRFCSVLRGGASATGQIYLACPHCKTSLTLIFDEGGTHIEEQEEMDDEDAEGEM